MFSVPSRYLYAFAATLILTMVLMNVAHAECSTVETQGYIERNLSRVPQSQAVMFEGLERRTIIERFNAIPPVTAFDPPEVWHVTSPATPVSLLVFGDSDGCVIAAQHLNAQARILLFGSPS